MSRIGLMVAMIIVTLASVNGQFANRISQISDDYLWTNCNPFESTKKNCPRGEQCLKLRNYKYAWNWAMRCQSREEFISRFDFEFDS